MESHEKAVRAFAISIILMAAVAILGIGLGTFPPPSTKRVNVEEVCEQLHTFMHDGKRYYCAPWIDPPEAPPARIENRA